MWLIEQQLLRMKGVVRVDLNYSTHRCRVVWDSAHIELSDILLKIRQTGYTAAPYDAQKIEAQAQKERKQFIVRLAVAGLGMMQTMMFALPTYFYGGDIEPLYLEILHWGGFLMVLPVVFYSALPFSAVHGARGKTAVSAGYADCYCHCDDLYRRYLQPGHQRRAGHVF